MAAALGRAQELVELRAQELAPRLVTAWEGALVQVWAQPLVRVLAWAMGGLRAAELVVELV